LPDDEESPSCRITYVRDSSLRSEWQVSGHFQQSQLRGHWSQALYCQQKMHHVGLEPTARGL